MTISSFYGATVPATPDAGPDAAVELGFKFKTTVNGWITHIRFYRAAANSGTHTVHLWDEGGLIASATATGETADAWNEVPLATAVAVTAGTLYTAGYHTDTAHYSLDAHYFDADVTSGQLFGPSSGSVSGNGGFGYGAAGTYPNDSFNNSNYGVDVLFTDTDPGASGITATLTKTQDNQTLTATASAGIAASLAKTQADQTLTAAAGVGIAASLAVTQANQTLAASAAAGIGASLAVTQGAQTLVATAAAAIAASLAVTQADQTLTAHLNTEPLAGITATLTKTQADQTLIAHARITTPGAALTLSEIIPAILNELVGGRVWQLATPDDLPRDSAKRILPFIIWHRVGGYDAEYVDQSELPDHRHARVQISSNAPGSVIAERLCEAVMQAMTASSYTVGVLGSPVGAYDNPRKLHAPFQQFSIWFRQST